MELDGLNVIIKNPIFVFIIAFLYGIFLFGLNVMDRMYEFLTETKFGIKNIYLAFGILIGIILNNPYLVSFFNSIGIEVSIIRLPLFVLEIILIYFSVIFFTYWFSLYMLGFFFFSLVIIFILTSIGKIFGDIGAVISLFIAIGIIFYWYGLSMFALICRVLLTPIDFILISISILSEGKLINRNKSLCPYELF